MLIREEVAAGISTALSADCTRPCRRVEELQAVVYGRAEDGRAGLGERVKRLEASMSGLGRVMWIAIGAGIVGLVTGALGAIFGK
jgi:hypothetical protein